MCPIKPYILVAQTWPKRPHSWLLFLSTGYKRAVLRTTILSNGRGHFGPTNWNDRAGQSGPSSKVFPNIPVRPKQNGLFHLISNWNFWNFGLNEKCLRLSEKKNIVFGTLMGAKDSVIVTTWSWKQGSLSSFSNITKTFKECLILCLKNFCSAVITIKVSERIV